MKKHFLMFLLCFLVFGMIFNSFTIYADRGDSGSSPSGDAQPSSSSTPSNSGNSVTTNTPSNTQNGNNPITQNNENTQNTGSIIKDLEKEKVSQQSKKEFKDDNKKIDIEKNIGTDENGNPEVIINKTIFNNNGTLSNINLQIKNEDNKTKIKIETKNESLEIETNLNISTNFENDSNLETTTSDGKKHKINVLPDQVKEIILQRLQAFNVSNITLQEINASGVPRVVYNLEINKDGKFLGVFKMAVKISGQIDSENGNVTSVNVPWWAFLITGLNNPIQPTNQTVFNNTTNNSLNSSTNNTLINITSNLTTNQTNSSTTNVISNGTNSTNSTP